VAVYPDSRAALEMKIYLEGSKCKKEDEKKAGLGESPSSHSSKKTSRNETSCESSPSAEGQGMDEQGKQVSISSTAVRRFDTVSSKNMFSRMEPTKKGSDAFDYRYPEGTKTQKHTRDRGRFSVREHHRRPQEPERHLR